jgi:hypothetical protein
MVMTASPAFTQTQWAQYQRPPADPVWQQPDHQTQINSLLEQAKIFYDELELEGAIELLEQALVITAVHSTAPSVVAELTIMMAVVEFAQTGNEETTVERLTNALLLNPSAVIDPYYTNPGLEAFMATAQREMDNRQQVSIPTPTAWIEHEPPITIRAGLPLTLLAEIPEGLGIRRIVIGYRIFGQTRYSRTNMSLSSPTEFFATISEQVTENAGTQLEYFLQALDSEDHTMAESASPEQPHIIVVLSNETEEPAPSVSEIQHYFSTAIGIGTGGGLASGAPLVFGSQVDLNPGIALTPLHFYFDALFHLGFGIEFGPFIRFQTVLLQTKIENELIIGGKVKWLFANTEAYRMYASLGGGYGHVRHNVDLSPTIDFVDTTREGPGHGGAGFGFVYLFTPNVGFLIDVYSMVLFNQVSVQLDVNSGLYFSF